MKQSKQLLFNIIVKILLISPSYLTAQFTSTNITLGPLFSDLSFSVEDKKSEKERNATDNAIKRGWTISIGTRYQFSERISLEGNISYQERLPLEIFVFEGEWSGLSRNVIAGFPTSPQSKIWDANKYIRFPNFKYSYFELVPMINFGKNNKIHTAIGVGFFYGYLINHRKLIFRQEHFPSANFFFVSPFDYSGADSYRQHDLGWLPRFTTTFRLKQKLNIKTAVKGYISQIELKRNTHSQYSPLNRSQSTNWIAFSFEIGIDFKISH